MPRILFAQMLMPIPLPQTRTAKSAFLSATARAAGYAKSG